MEKETPKFEVIVLGIILDTESKRVLIGKRKEGQGGRLLGWGFPGGRILPGEEIDKALKERIKLKTGYSVKNIGTFFSQTHDENPNLISITFLTSVYQGKELPGDDIEELKWVEIRNLEKYFKIPLHIKLKEFLSELV